MALTPGSAEWLEIARRDIGGDQRLVQDFLIAKTFLERIVSGWEALDPLIAAALHKSAVVSYARPFKESIGLSGKKYRYPVRRISDSAGFDREVHDHLLHLRDGMVAHSDAELAERTINLGVIEVTSEEVKGRIVFQASAQSAAIFGFNDIALAKAQLQHVEAGLIVAQGLLREGLASYLQAVQQHPSQVLDEGTASDARLMHVATLKDISGGGTMNTAIPPAAGMLKAPQFKVGADRYRYFVLEIAERATGTVVLRDENGKEYQYVLGWHLGTSRDEPTVTEST